MKKKFGFLFLLILLTVIISMAIIKIVNKNITPTVIEYSKTEIKRMASIIINQSISEEVLKKNDIDKLFIVDKNTNDEVISVTLDSVVVNQITNDISDACERNLRLMENRDFSQLESFNISEKYFYVPSGIAFNNTFFNSIGPLIPINLKIIGNVTSGIDVETKEYGINNSVITISVEVNVELRVILPLTTDSVSITNYVPIAIKLIQGKVPNYYGGDVSLKKESFD